jgi:hypothetical protein
MAEILRGRAHTTAIECNRAFLPYYGERYRYGERICSCKPCPAP